MKKKIISDLLILMVFILAMSCSVANAKPQATQTFTLHPGWNAIFLEVQVMPRDPATVFEGLPVESVWTWLDQHSTVEFLQNPDEGLWNKPGWHGYFPDEEKALLTNLFAVIANQAYLIKLSGDNEISWSVTGCPSVKKIKWIPDSFNLAGFHVNPDIPPNFQDFFSGLTSHAGQAIYRLNRQGKWEFVEKPSIHFIQTGEAYWVYCSGGSDFQAPLDINLPMVEGFNYGATLTQLTITLHNISEVPRTITLALSSSDVVLAYKEYVPSTGFFSWPLLDEMSPILLAPGRQDNIQLTVRREGMSPGVAESVLVIKDDKGIQIRVPVIVEKVE